MMVCSGEKQELYTIYKETKNQAALLTEDKWDIHTFETIKEVAIYMKDHTILDAVCFDITLDGGIEMLEKIRLQNKKAYIVLIASSEISPISYIRPTIMASALLLRPIDPCMYRKAIQEMLDQFQRETNLDEDLFILESREGKYRIPYQNIYCFEARTKKIYACTSVEEYGFYEALDKLQEHLPEYFVRCHRGFIVNTKKIKKVALSESLLYLEDNYLVPLSRSYKSILKEYG